jgi:hypothetical protein
MIVPGDMAHDSFNN